MIKTAMAMVMAAGHGTRMRPLTNDRSKAMVEVDGKPLIDHMLDRLAEVGVERAVVNLHAHADHLEDLKKRKNGPKIIISDEREELLETGGGVVKAMPLLGDDPIFICNIDARADWSLGYGGKGDFNIHDDARLTRREGESAKHVYAGVQIFKPALAKPFKLERFSRNKIWDETLKRRKLFGAQLPGYWMHVGDPRAVIAAEAVLKEANG